MPKTTNIQNIVNVESPQNELSLNSRGGDISPRKKTKWRKYSYVSATVPILGLLLWFLHRVAQKHFDSRSVLVGNEAALPHGAIDQPWPGLVPWLVTFGGPIFNVPPDRDLFIVIGNDAGQLFFYAAINEINRFECAGHHLGEKNEAPGQKYTVRLFLAARGVKIPPGLCTIVPAGEFVSDPVSYQRQ